MQRLPECEPAAARLLVGASGGLLVEVLADQIAQDREEVRHRLTSAGLTPLDTADRDARLGHDAGLVHQLRESSTTQVRRPPQTPSRDDRCLDVISAERQCAAPYSRLDLRLVARRSLALPSTHVRNDTGGANTSPLPQTPTQRPTGARLFY
jgi:hypothetical protein